MLKDKDIREPLFEFLETEFGKIRIYEEKDIGASRADVLMVTGDSFCGIEIKSDADTFTRLSRQAADYDRYFDYNFAAVGTSHALHVSEHIPPHWGIITVEEIDGKADFYIYRRPQPNPNLNLKLKLSLLWRPELQDIIRKYPFKYEYLRQSKPFVIDKIAAAVPYEQLRQTMSYELFERDYELEMQQINTFRKEVEGKKRAKRRLKHPKRKRRALTQ